MGGVLSREAALLPAVAAVLQVAVPEPLLLGLPSAAFPLRWALVGWIDGEVPRAGEIDADQPADAVAGLRSLDPAPLPPAGRPAPTDAAQAEEVAATAAALGRIRSSRLGRATLAEVLADSPDLSSRRARPLPGGEPDSRTGAGQQDDRGRPVLLSVFCPADELHSSC